MGYSALLAEALQLHVEIFIYSTGSCIIHLVAESFRLPLLHFVSSVRYNEVQNGL